MSIISLASGASVWRGYDYYKSNKILQWTKLTPTEFDGVALGNENREYKVYIDIKHPRKSKCNCPHADGRRIICKHQIALFFTAFPEEAENYYREVIEYEEMVEREEEERENRLIKYIDSLTKDELRQELYDLLEDVPEWLRDRYIESRIGY